MCVRFEPASEALHTYVAARRLQASCHQQPDLNYIQVLAKVDFP